MAGPDRGGPPVLQHGLLKLHQEHTAVIASPPGVFTLASSRFSLAACSNLFYFLVLFPQLSLAQSVVHVHILKRGSYVEEILTDGPVNFRL